MARRKKQNDIEDAITEKTNGAKPGHNSQLTDEERRALTLHHKKAYEAADALVEKAKNDRSAVAELAKHDLGKSAVAEFKEMIEDGDPKKLRSKVERTMRLARWAGLPVNFQPSMFEAPVDRREEGKSAGMAGEECKPPQSLAHDAGQTWIAGWHEGQQILASAFLKKRKPAEPDGADDEPRRADPGNDLPIERRPEHDTLAEV